MEELQDAIEDAQYMHAMHNEAPQPTVEWDWPSADQLNEAKRDMISCDPSLMEIEYFCKMPLGFHLVRNVL